MNFNFTEKRNLLSYICMTWWLSIVLSYIALQFADSKTAFAQEKKLDQLLHSVDIRNVDELVHFGCSDLILLVDKSFLKRKKIFEGYLYRLYEREGIKVSTKTDTQEVMSSVLITQKQLKELSIDTELSAFESRFGKSELKDPDGGLVYGSAEDELAHVSVYVKNGLITRITWSCL